MKRPYVDIPLPDKWKDFVPAEGTGYIYKISRVCPSGREKGYVGLSTAPFKKRIADHLAHGSGCLAIHAALMKYGRNNFSYEILEHDIPVNELRQREEEMIALHCTYGKGRGYNLTKGGDINPMHDPEVRERHKSTMRSKEFVEKSAIKRTKTFRTTEYIDRTSNVHIESWSTVVDREKHRSSIKMSWERDYEKRVESMQDMWNDDEFKRRRLEGIRLHFQMKKDPNVTPEQLAEFKKQKARENGRRAREKKRAKRTEGLR